MIYKKWHSNPPLEHASSLMTQKVHRPLKTVSFPNFLSSTRSKSYTNRRKWLNFHIANNSFIFSAKYNMSSAYSQCDHIRFSIYVLVRFVNPGSCLVIRVDGKRKMHRRGCGRSFGISYCG